MVSDDVLAAADRNMRSAWRALSALGPAPGMDERPDAVLFRSGLPIPLFNPAFVTADPADPDELVADVRARSEAAGVPFVLYFRDERAPTLAAACAAAGLVEHYQPPLMVMDPITPSPAEPPGVEIAVVDESNLSAYCAVLGEGFGMPLELVLAAFTPAVLAIEPMLALLALVDGTPAATSAVFVSDGLAGVYNVTTVPSQRGKGVGAAITWAAVDAGASRGATASILQASEAGAPVYARMGFAMPDRYRQFERPS
jgi:N-acetylglutamate synthase